jgi:hypothetical protein
MPLFFYYQTLCSFALLRQTKVNNFYFLEQFIPKMSKACFRLGIFCGTRLFRQALLFDVIISNKTIKTTVITPKNQRLHCKKRVSQKNSLHA